MILYKPVVTGANQQHQTSVETYAVNGILGVIFVVYCMVLPKAKTVIFRVFAEKKVRDRPWFSKYDVTL